MKSTILSIARFTGLATTWNTLLTLLARPPMPSREARKPISSGTLAASAASTILGTPAEPPLAMAMTASRTELTNSTIWAPWFTMNVTMSMIPLTARMKAEAGLRREMIQVMPAMMTVGMR